MESYIELLRHRAENSPQRIAIATAERNLSYLEVYEQSLAFAGFLRQQGVRKGDRIAILEWNTPEAFFIWMGAVFNGAVAVFLNWRLSPAEHDFILTQSDSKLLLYGKSFAAAVKDVKIPKLDLDEVSPGDLLPVGELVFHPEVLQLYTSGTTGFPKGVVLTHKSMLSMVNSVFLELPAFGGNAVNLVAGPFFNIAGAGYISLGIYAGAKNVLPEKFDPSEAAAAIDRFRVTNAFLAPAMVLAILGLPDLAEYSFSSLINIHYGGSVMPLPLLKKAREIFNCYFTQGYGLTETSGITTLLRFDDHEKALNHAEHEGILFSAGRPVAGMKIIVVDGNGNSLGKNQEGEILIQGGNLSNGYYKNEAFTINGYFASGDIGKMDEDGYLYIIDRKNDMIVSGGVNIYPAELERHLEQHEAIREVAVVGIPDEKFGERPAVFVNSVNKQLRIDEINEFLQGKIAKFKLPVKIVHMDSLPRNSGGKVLRTELRKPFWENRERRLG